jgi:secreted PhoX family phosphatase
MLTRREFNKSMLSTALSGLALHLSSTSALANVNMSGFGDLIADPKGMLDLPAGFRYHVISTLGQAMDDGLTVPDRADGMGCIALDDERVALVRNHELQPKHSEHWPVQFSQAQIANAYDVDAKGRPLSGGTSTLIYNIRSKQIEQQFMSLLGTIRNCSGGVTPWGSWLSCEESVEIASDQIKKDHGYVFEVSTQAKSLAAPTPIKAMGRFNHEAACVDPTTGIVYLTEDRNDSLLYRFIPNHRQSLLKGGRLQALVIKENPQFDSRNWGSLQMSKGIEYPCEWIDLDDVESPKDDLRQRGFSQGAALFARGEGICLGDNDLYFCCTSGGAKKLGQVMRYSLKEDTPTLSLFLESEHPASFNYGDNLCTAPNGHLIVCEDQYVDPVNNHLKGVRPNGETYDLAKVRWQTEPAGACFSPDGTTLFVNLYSPTATIAITGPWENAS